VVAAARNPVVSARATSGSQIGQRDATIGVDNMAPFLEIGGELAMIERALKQPIKDTSGYPPLMFVVERIESTLKAYSNDLVCGQRISVCTHAMSH
jgi:hypothetical protein